MAGKRTLRTAVRHRALRLDARALARVEAKLGHKFSEKDLLRQALTHPSAGAAGAPHFQRLEFLGDRVLGLVAAHLLYKAHPQESEGALSKRFVALARRETLARIARTLGLGAEVVANGLDLAEIGREDERTEKALADALEAVIGALYLDSGLEPAERFIARHWQPFDAGAPTGDAKTLLQEWAQARGLALPRYRLVEKVGPEHAPQFRVEASVAGHPPRSAEHGIKRTAEQLAALSLLELIRSAGNA